MNLDIIGDTTKKKTKEKRKRGILVDMINAMLASLGLSNIFWWSFIYSVSKLVNIQIKTTEELWKIENQT